MRIPFSHEAFLDVFGRYNTDLWPSVLLLWLVTAWVAWRWFRREAVSGRVLFGLLAVHWIWSGVLYHWIHFRPIDPAATLFAAGFIVEGVFFGWLAATWNGAVVAHGSRRSMVGGALVGYGLAYPLIGLAFGLSYPRLPLFAVPCPTTLVTAGWLIAIGSVPRIMTFVPILWAVIGSSAAIALGIRADLALAIAAALMLVDVFFRSAFGPRTARPGERAR